VTELARHRVDSPFIVRFEQRILCAPDRVHHRAGDAVLARQEGFVEAVKVLEREIRAGNLPEPPG
jgi:hypothetical protein